MTSIKQSTLGHVLLLELVETVSEDSRSFEGVQAELSGAWKQLDGSDDLRVAVLSGADGAFSLGSDHGQSADGPSWDLDALPLQTGKPVIAAVEGACYGLGFELALACDLRVAAEGSSFGFPDLGVSMPFRVASVLLPRITFAGLSLELLLSGRTLDATQAFQGRLANRVVTKGEALRSAIDMAESLVDRFGNDGDFKKQRILRMSGVPLVTAMNLAREP